MNKLKCIESIPLKRGGAQTRGGQQIRLILSEGQSLSMRLQCYGEHETSINLGWEKDFIDAIQFLLKNCVKDENRDHNDYESFQYSDKMYKTIIKCCYRYNCITIQIQYDGLILASSYIGPIDDIKSALEELELINQRNVNA